MSKTKTFIAAVTFAALLSAPVVALDMSADAMIGAAPEDMTVLKMMDDSAFVGNEVRTKDQIVIGQVESVFEGPDGMPMVLITINSDIAAQSSVKSFTMPLAADMTADGSLTLAWNESELFIALDSQLKANVDG